MNSSSTPRSSTSTNNSNTTTDKRFFVRRSFPLQTDSSETLKDKARAGKLKSSGGSSVGTPVQALISSKSKGKSSPTTITTLHNKPPTHQHHHHHHHGNISNSGTREQPPHSAHGSDNTLQQQQQVASSSLASEKDKECQTQAVRVAVRLRPLNPLEVLASKRSSPKSTKSPSSEDAYDTFKAWNLERHDGKDLLVQKGANRKVEGKNMFSFDGIFQENIGTAHVYENFARPIVQAVLDGKHGTIFTYGTSGSGKTHSMQGDGKHGSLHKDGIIQLAVRDLFNHIRKDSGKREYVMRITFMEIYNETVRDLLATRHHHHHRHSSHNSHHHNSNSNGRSSPRNTTNNNNSDPSIVNVDQGKAYALDSAKEQVSSVDDVLKLLYAGNENRAVATTILNDASSRSHAIFRLTIESRERGARGGDNKRQHSDSEHVKRVSALNFVDLAGSENTTKAATVGSRRRESGKINQSLLSLSQVIHALSLPPKKKPKFINYRNSKLTRILQPHLSGNAVLGVLCCATAAQASLEETRSTLKFGFNAKRIEMKPIVNEIVDDKVLIQKLQRELREAQDAIKTLQQKDKPVERRKKLPPRIDTSVGLTNESPNFSSRASSPVSSSGSPTDGTRCSECDGGDKEERMEKTEREGTPNHSRVEPSPLASPELSHSSTPDRVESPNNLSANSKIFDLNAVLLDKRLRNCDQDSRAERSVERDCTSTISDLSSRRPPTIRVFQDSPPSEVTIIRSPLSSVGDDVDVNVRLNDAEERAKFLEEKLEAADRLVELMTRDLRNARLCIHELVFRNVRLENQLAAHQSGTPVPSTVDVTDSHAGGTEDGSRELIMATERIGI